MVVHRSHMSRQALRDLFARASARRAERRRFVETMRTILEHRESLATLLVKLDRRMRAREAEA